MIFVIIYFSIGGLLAALHLAVALRDISRASKSGIDIDHLVSPGKLAIDMAVALVAWLPLMVWDLTRLGWQR